MAVNLTLSISRQFLLDLRPSADIRQAAGPGLPQLGQVWGPQDQEVPNQAAFDVGDNTLLCVLEAPLAEVQHLATTCDWLAHVAFHVFGAMGMLYEPNNALIFAPANRQLAAVDYIFYPAGIQTARSIFLMRYFPGAMPAVPAPGNTGGNVKTTFSGDVQRRENQLCKISGFDRHLGYKNVCSHLIPKRLGPHVVSHIMLRLTGRLPGWGNGPPQWDASVAVLLYGALDGFVDRFKMGFYKPKPPAPNNIPYLVHHFDDPVPAASQDVNNMRGWTKLALRWSTITSNNLGGWQSQIATLNLHGIAVDFPARPTNNVRNPHYYVLGWHYAQCVIRKWSTQAYKNYSNIYW